MPSARRPKYLQDMDDVQDCIEETPGLTLKQISEKTGIGYPQTCEAALRLHHRGYITRKRHKALTFYPNP